MGKAEFSDDSLRAIATIKKPLFERAPTGYQKAWLDAYQPNKNILLDQTTTLCT